MFETTSFLCVSARLFGWQAAKTSLQMSVLFNDLISESLIEPCSMWANPHSTRITSRSDQTGRNGNRKNPLMVSHQAFFWWSRAATSFLLIVLANTHALFSTWHVPLGSRSRPGTCQGATQCLTRVCVSLKGRPSSMLLPHGDFLGFSGHVNASLDPLDGASFAWEYTAFPPYTGYTGPVCVCVWSRWLHHCLHKSCGKHSEDREAHLELRGAKMGCSSISFWQAVDGSVLEITSWNHLRRKTYNSEHLSQAQPYYHTEM